MMFVLIDDDLHPLRLNIKQQVMFMLILSDPLSAHSTFNGIQHQSSFDLDLVARQGPTRHKYQLAS